MRITPVALTVTGLLANAGGAAAFTLAGGTKMNCIVDGIMVPEVVLLPGVRMLPKR